MSGLLFLPFLLLPAQGDRSGQVDQSLNKPDARGEPAMPARVPRIELPPQDPRETTDAARVTFDVARIEISGNRAIADAELRPAVAGLEGRRVTLAELRAAARRMTRIYSDGGYPLAFAYVPAQDPKDGVVRIHVVEGRVGRILLSGNEHFSSEFILSRFAALQEQDRTPDRASLERGLVALNSFPGLEIHATFRPGDEAGTTDLYLDARDRKPIRSWMELDNYGAESVSEWRLGAVFEAGNLFELGHSADARLTMGENTGDLIYGRLSYAAPVGDATLRLFWSRFEYQASGSLSPLEPGGTGNVFGLTGSYPFILRQTGSMVGEIGFEWRNLDQELLGSTVSKDRLRVVVAGIRLELAEEGRSRSMAWMQIRQGIPGFMGGLENDDPNASRAGAGGGYTKATVQLLRVQRLSDTVTLVGRALGQYASEPLVSSEQLGLGGSDSVRGYAPFKYSGDRGWQATVEARLRLYETLEGVVFHDWAMARRIEAAPGEARKGRLTGYGAGFRLNLREWGSLKVEAGFPTAREPSDGDDVQVFVGILVNIY